MADSTTTAERAAFETWFEADAMPLEHSNWFQRDFSFPEMYCLDAVQQAWKGWAARAGVNVDE